MLPVSANNTRALISAGILPMELADNVKGSSALEAGAAETPSGTVAATQGPCAAEGHLGTKALTPVQETG